MTYEGFLESSDSAIERLSELSYSSMIIEQFHYDNHDVKRGLRDVNGKGVIAGLTEISDIISYSTVDGKTVPREGELYYRGINIKQLVRGFMYERRHGFEESAYLLLFGKLPNADELSELRYIISGYRSLPSSFLRDVIMKAPSEDMMNLLARCVLTLYSYDNNPDDISCKNVLRQCLQLIAQFPLLAVYGYQVKRHYYDGESLIIHHPRADLSTAENLLYLLRPDGAFTPLEAEILDLCMVLHQEHGGGNNSSFTTHVVSSSGTDTYSAVAASLGSLKGPRHGGANIKVVKMIEDIKSNIDIGDENALRVYLKKILDKEAFDKSGLIYGMGHAVYSLSDPRADVLKSCVKKLAAEKHMDKEFELYGMIERIAPEIIMEKRKIYKGVSANIDFYSGLVYSILGLPPELFTPIFAVSRIVGWSAHRIEEIVNNGKIIRPGYVCVLPHAEYKPLAERN